MSYHEFICKRERLIKRLRKLNVKVENLTLLSTIELEKLCKHHTRGGNFVQL